MTSDTAILIRNADRGPHFAAAIRESAKQLQDLGCRVLAEGVETEAQHDVLSDCPIELAQGWLYGRPASIDDMALAGHMADRRKVRA